MLLIHCKLIAYAEVHLECIAHGIKSAVTTCLNNALLLTLLDCHCSPDSVLLLEMALRNREYIRLTDIVILKYLIHNRRCKFLVLAVRNTLHKIAYLLLHLIRNGNTEVLLKDVGYTALTRLAVDTDDIRLVLSSDVHRVDRKIWDSPLPVRLSLLPPVHAL